MALKIQRYPLRRPCPFSDGGKHGRLVTDGRYIYELGGDYAGSPGYRSGRSELWRLDTQALTDGQPAPWELLVPYCGEGQEVMPGRPDEVPICYDSRRNVLVWCAGGFAYNTFGPCETHPNVISTSEWGEFDLATNKWRKIPSPQGPELRGRNQFHAQYDPVRDVILIFGLRELAVIDRKTNVRTVYEAPSEVVSRWVSSQASLEKEYTAVDLVGRWIYVQEPTTADLIRVNLDDYRWEVYSTPAPRLDYIGGTGKAVIKGQQMLFWTGDRVLGCSTWREGPEPGPGSLHGDFRLWQWDGQFQWLPNQANGVQAWGNVGVWVGGVGLITLGGFDDESTEIREDAHMTATMVEGVVEPPEPTPEPTPEPNPTPEPTPPPEQNPVPTDFWDCVLKSLRGCLWDTLEIENKEQALICLNALKKYLEKQ